MSVAPPMYLEKMTGRSLYPCDRFAGLGRKTKINSSKQNASALVKFQVSYSVLPSYYLQIHTASQFFIHCHTNLPVPHTVYNLDFLSRKTNSRHLGQFSRRCVIALALPSETDPPRALHPCLCKQTLPSSSLQLHKRLEITFWADYFWHLT